MSDSNAQQPSSTIALGGLNKWKKFSETTAELHPALKGSHLGTGGLHRIGINYKPQASVIHVSATSAKAAAPSNVVHSVQKAVKIGDTSGVLNAKTVYESVKTKGSAKSLIDLNSSDIPVSKKSRISSKALGDVPPKGSNNKPTRNRHRSPAARVKPQVDPAKPQTEPVKPQATPVKPQTARVKPQVNPTKQQTEPVKPQATPAKSQTEPVKSQATPAKLQTARVKPQITPIKPPSNLVGSSGEPNKVSGKRPAPIPQLFAAARHLGNDLECYANNPNKFSRNTQGSGIQGRNPSHLMYKSLSTLDSISNVYLTDSEKTHPHGNSTHDVSLMYPSSPDPTCLKIDICVKDHEGKVIHSLNINPIGGRVESEIEIFCRDCDIEHYKDVIRSAIYNGLENCLRNAITS